MDSAELGKTPISPDSPAGQDVRYEPEYEALQGEIDKMSNPSASGGLDWNKVNKLAAQILAEKGKDLLVASYLAVGQTHTNHVEGFVLGLRIYRDLLEHFWDDLFPVKKRMRGRVAAIQWWLEKTEAAAESTKWQPYEAEKVEEFRENLRAIDTFLRDNVEELILLRPLERFIDSIPLKAEKEAVEEPAPKESSPHGGAAAPQADKPIAPQPAQQQPTATEIASTADAEKVIEKAFETIGRASTFILAETPTSAMAYRLRRLSIWSMLEASPPSTDDKTIVPPPDTTLRDSLQTMRTNGSWQELINVAEENVSESIFWLDLHRLTAEGLAALGDSYEGAHDAICQETALFMQRLPGLANLCFADGTPFADHDTQQWLRGLGLSSGEAISEPASTEGGKETEHMTEVMKKAQALAKKKKLAEAVATLQQELQHSYARMDQLRWRLGLAQILLGAKKPQPALPHLEALLFDIETFKLEKWDPDLALKCLTCIWSGFSALNNDTIKERLPDILGRIARLDPAGSLKLSR